MDNKTCNCTDNNSEKCIATDTNCKNNANYDSHNCNLTEGEYWCKSSNS